jgi:hypothetical protein
MSSISNDMIIRHRKPSSYDITYDMASTHRFAFPRWKSESMIGMNALIDLEYAAGTLSVDCTDEQSINTVQTAFKLIRKK